MAIYRAPVEDLRFVLHDLIEIDQLQSIPGYEEVTPDIIDSVLDEAGRFCEEVLFPLNRTGDEEGCHFENGVVRTPAGFKEAYKQFTDGGWMGLYCEPRFGGQGLPGTLYLSIDEMLCASNLSFSSYVALTHGAYNAIATHANEDLKQRYLPPMVAGRWTGTMCLTEPQCGTDLGLIRTRAALDSEGAYRLQGTKIFISAGEHDLSENIIHLALARTPDAPPGIKGLSLFLVPKFTVNADATLGPRNGVSCGAIESKMGIKASSTCVINFDDAEGYLLGTLHNGIHAMFTMMNSARLEVSVQGTGLSDVAYQGAVAYARERVQGRALKGVQNPDKAADPIICHPDVRRMLLTMRAYSEGGRALGAWVALHVDLAAKHPQSAVRRDAQDLLALMTPVLKALLTDIGLEVANLGIQVYGGHGYIRENGMEQYARDARITQIYEGTNGIQALDLVGRKLGAHTGRYLRQFFHPVQSYIDAHASNKVLAEFVGPLAKAFGRLQQATGWIAQAGLGDPEQAGGVASDYLRLLGLVAMGYMWTRMAEISQERLAGEAPGANGESAHDRAFYEAKLGTARFFMQKLLPQTGALFAIIMVGSDTIMEFDETAF